MERDLSYTGTVRPAGEARGEGLCHAVIIGINRYQDDQIRDLQYAVADAEALRAVLVDAEAGGFPEANVTVLLDGEATKRNIATALGTRLPRAAGVNDVVLIYFGGHGAVEPDASADDGLRKYLIPHDGEVDDLFATAIPVEDIEQYFRRIRANRVLFFVDSCYSGGAGGRTFLTPVVAASKSVSLTSTFLERLGAARKGRFVVTSCGPNELALEPPDLGHGVFTHHLVEGLRGMADQDGDGLVAMDELFLHLVRHVPDTAARFGGAMTPIQTGSTDGRVFLTRYETVSARLARVRAAFEAKIEAALRDGSADDAESRLLELEAGLGEPSAADPGMLDRLMDAYEQIAAHDCVLALLVRLGEPAAGSASTRLRHARVAIRRGGPGDLDDAEWTLEALLREPGEHSPEAYSLLGAIQTTHYEAAAAAGSADTERHWRNAIGTYRIGFERTRDTDLGLGAVSLLLKRGTRRAVEEAEQLSPVVLFGMEKLVTHENPWRFADYFEMALVARQPDLALEYMPWILLHADHKEPAIRDRTAATVRRLVELRRQNGEDTSALERIAHVLENPGTDETWVWDHCDARRGD
jgi:hypothetical protein